MHPSINYRTAEDILKNCVHDVRQPLATIETSVMILSLLFGDSLGSGAEYLRTIERQVELAARTLENAAAELRRLSLQADDVATFEEVGTAAAR